MSDTWTIRREGFDPDTNPAVEGLFALGNGYLHVRGCLEEHLADAPQNRDFNFASQNVTAAKFPATKAKWGTYVPGVYANHPARNRELVNLPWFLALAPVVDGERLDLAACDVSEHVRLLDLRAATLNRSLIWRTRSGATVEATWRMFACADRPHLFIQQMALRSDRDVDLAVVAAIEADVRTCGYDHLAEVTVEADADAAEIDCRAATPDEDSAFMVSRLAGDFDWQALHEDRRAALGGRIDLPAGQGVVIEKRTAVTTSRDEHTTAPQEVLDAVAHLTCEDLHESHAALWAYRWDRCDVVIEGDERSQAAMRCSLYHLLRVHPDGDSRVAIDAKGYAGDAYYGRFFWDTEMYLLPFYAYTDPPRARTLVDFRIRGLDAARANAAAGGYRGARYPWQTAEDGGEQTFNWQYRDHEIHVSADVVYAACHYAAATGDDGVLTGRGAEMVADVGRFWLDRLDTGPDGRPALLGVMGPDEHAPLTHNNAFTKRMVQFALAAAAGPVGAAGGATPDERLAFSEACEALPIVRSQADPRLVLQHEAFERLAAPRFDLWADRSKPCARFVSQERLYRSRNLKQADVLMLMALFPHEFSDEEVRVAWDYYVPVTTHDSSLSKGIHAIVARRLHLADEAWGFWQDSCGVDLDGGSAEGVHIAAAGANWMMAVLGFAGVATAMEADVLTVRPFLPAAWRRLAFPLQWKGTPVTIAITRDRTEVTNRGDRPLPVCVAGHTCTLAPGQTETF